MPVLPLRPGSSRRSRGARLSGARLAGALACLGLLVASCGKEPVSIPTLRLTAADQAVCQRVVDALPDELGGQGKRKTQPAAALGGAWGDPAFVVQCGAPKPAEVTRTSQCTVVDGVGWFVPPDQENDPGADASLTALGYKPYLQLTVPAKYRGADLGAAEVELAPIVKQYLRKLDTCR